MDIFIFHIKKILISTKMTVAEQIFRIKPASILIPTNIYKLFSPVFVWFLWVFEDFMCFRRYIWYTTMQPWLLILPFGNVQMALHKNFSHISNYCVRQNLNGMKFMIRQFIDLALSNAKDDMNWSLQNSWSCVT